MLFPVITFVFFLAVSAEASFVNRLFSKKNSDGGCLLSYSFLNLVKVS
jgi:hypothetical protein